MAGQASSGGNKKRPGRPRKPHKIMQQEKRKERWLAALAINKKAQHPRKRDHNVLDLSHEHIIPKEIRPRTFEDLYKTYRVTKGRQGLNPNPETRQKENYWVTHRSIARFPITELMEKPIQYPPKR